MASHPSEVYLEPDAFYVFLVSSYSASLVIAGVLATKIVTVFGLVVPAGVIAYCITFLCTDTAAELYGKGPANRMVCTWTNSGFSAR